MEASTSLPLASRPSIIEHVIALLVTLIILEQHSRLPEADFLIVGLAFFCVLGLGVVYCVRLEQTRSVQAVRPRSTTLLHWMVLPAAIVLMLSSAATHWPASIRFHLSKSGFDELIAQARQGQKPVGFPRRVGLYWIEKVRDAGFDYATGRGTIGFVTGVALIDECGLRYDPLDRPSSHYLTTRIAPHWSVTEW